MGLNVQRAELVCRHDVISQPGKGLTGWPDGILGFRWPNPPRDQPTWFCSNNGNVAMLDVATGTIRKSPRAAKLPAEFSYCSGGPIITNPKDGSWLMIAHTEQKPSQGHFYGCLSLLKSTDGGANWTWLGVIVEPAYQYQDPNPVVCEIAGGAVVFNGSKLCVYFRETTPAGRGQACVAWCEAEEVFAAALSGGVSQWTKWTDGAIGDEGAPAVGGGLGTQLPGLPAEADWMDVKWLADRQQFFAADCPWNDDNARGMPGKRIYGYTSADGIHWSLASNKPLADDPGSHYYPTLVPVNADERFAVSTPHLWLYYMTVPNLQTVWPGAEVHRRKLTFS